MSADLLRRAAALMRERAGFATPGRWAVSADGIYVDPEWSDEGWLTYSAMVAEVDPMTEGMLTLPDGVHIASWHPAVALAVADWLDEQAVAYMYNERAWRAGAADPRNRWEERGLTVERNLEHHHRHALAVARAYLGES